MVSCRSFIFWSRDLPDASQFVGKVNLEQGADKASALNRNLRFVGVLLLLFLSYASRSFSQSPQVQGTVSGRVTDEDQQPVEAAQVKLEHVGGPTFLGITDGTGTFLIEHVPYGDYSLTLSKAAFYILKDVPVTVSESSPPLELTLNHSEEVHERVAVTAQVNGIDPVSTTQTATLTDIEIRNIPVPNDHTLSQSLVAMPQIVLDNSGLLHLAGARNTQSQYLLDGFEIGDPVSGLLTARLSVDAVRGAEVQTGRFGAEYYHPGAAILGLNTPEGDDRWRFGATNFIPGVSFQNGVQLGDYYPRFFLSGPILPGKVWFSESVSLIYNLNIVKGLPSGQNEGKTFGGDSLTRLLWVIAPNHSLHFSFLYNTQDASRVGLSSLQPIPATTEQDNHRFFGSLRDQVFTHRTLIQTGFSIDQTHNDISPYGTLPFIQLVNGAEGNWFESIRQNGARYQGWVNATTTALHWHGTHTLAIGMNASSIGLSQNAARTEIQACGGVEVVAPLLPCSAAGNLNLVRTSTFAGSGRFNDSDTLAGAFVQDAWTLDPHFVAQLGLRMDWDRLTQSTLPGPSASLNYLPFKNDRSKFSVGWGMYDVPLNLSVIGQTLDQREIDTLYDAQGNVTAGPAATRFVMPANGLQQQFFGIASAGYQQRIGNNTIVSVEGLARNEHHGLVYTNLFPGQIGTTFELESGRRDKYRGITVSARHTFPNSAELFGAYTYSRATTDLALDPVYGQLYFAQQQSGPLAWDAPESRGGLGQHAHASVGFVLRVFSGVPHRLSF